ncbi:MAG: ABC transporter permease [Clostridia bacterium]|nr:ABC transporter permease [Clostridia bacterium]
MKSMPDFFFMAAKNVGRGRWRSGLTIVAIVIGLTAVLLLTTIGESGKNLIHKELTGIGIDGIMIFSDDHSGLGLRDGERIVDRIDSVTSVMPFETAIGYYRVRSAAAETAVAIGVDPLAVDYMSLEVLHGRMFSESECQNTRPVCVVGTDFALETFKRENVVGREVELTLNGHTAVYTIIGVANSALNELSSLIGVRLPPFLYLPYSIVGDAENLSQIAVQVSADANAAETADQIRTLLRKTNTNGPHFLVENMSGYVTEFAAVVDVVTIVLAATAAISLIVAGIGIMNSMLATVSDRKSEIGVMKAIGASATQIAVIFLSEALILTLIGCIAGLVLAAILLIVANAQFASVLHPTANSILFPLAITLAVGLLSGLLPAISAARLQPIEAIRCDG